MRALVTGGGRGIGADIARELARAGWHVTVTGRTAEQVEQIAQEIGGSAVVGDVSRREDVERMVAAAEPIDLLVANAGIALWEGEGAWVTDPDEWWHVFEVNVLGVHLTCRAAIPGMIERGAGRIVITGSGASYLPGSTSSAYAASKAAVGRFG
jgi:NAD(P)-dependent dehydrogenase (short-subunit alcohol dehydrogenase family)